ncbi:MAG: tetratricopeptide repeat protein [Ignavibacteriales bacterium]|nr:tetratricopeptide repeat protein [Ignavibacteriales bacterium]
MKALNSSLACCFALAVFVIPAGAQDPEAMIKLRLAQSFESAGDWERAVAIYESLLLSDPQNYVYYDALRRGYVQLKEYEKAVGLIEYRLTIQKNNPQLLATLGGVYYQMGREQKADSLWQWVIREDPKNPSLYRLIAGQMMEFRLYDRAIELFLQARKATGDPYLFLSELANLYGAFQQYDRAMEEFIQLLVLQPKQLSDIQSRISVFIAHPEALTSARDVARKALERHADLNPLRQLYAWILMEGKDYVGALEQYKRIDRTAGARGAELFKFAQRALDDREYRAAASACQEVLNTGPARELVPLVRLGYARAVEELTIDQDTTVAQRGETEKVIPESSFSSGTALSLYVSVVQQYPGTLQAAQAYFRIGVLQRDRFRDLDAALMAFEQATKTAPGSQIALESHIEAADVLVARNDLKRAREVYGILVLSRNSFVRDQALFRLAELDYFTAEFDSALAVLDRLSAKPGTDLANDALNLRYFIEENRTLSPDALKVYAATDLLLRQKKYPEALEAFRAVVHQFSLALLVDDATFRIGELLIQLRRYNEALETFQKIARDMKSSILRDRALMKAGEVYEMRLHVPARALEAYEELLSRFPGSIYAEEARRRIRLLRGDAL